MTDAATPSKQLDLSFYTPLSRMTEVERAMLATEINLLAASKGATLIRAGADDNRALFLVRGSIEVRATDGRGYTIEAGGERAKQAVSHLVPHKYDVVALTPAVYFWIDNQVLDNIAAGPGAKGEPAEHLAVDPELLANPLFQTMLRDLHEDRLVVPALPDVVARYRNIVRDDADIKRVKTLIQTDPALTALLMKVANSAVYRASKPIGTIEQAIVRIGLKALQNFVIGYALRRLFKTKSANIKRQMELLWQHSTEVAAISYVLAKRLGNFDADHAMLLGLLHDIGVLPILSYSEMFPEIAADQNALAATIKKLHGDVGGLIMTKWNFPEDCAQVAREADDWHRDKAAEADYADLVLVAQIFSFMGKQLNKDTVPLDTRALPALTELPAYRKLGLGAATPEESMQLLHDAKGEIAESLHMLAI